MRHAPVISPSLLPSPRSSAEVDDAPIDQRISRRLVVGTLASLMLGSLTGCSLVIMANKMVFGDPTVTSRFKTVVHVDLARDKKKVLVVCSAPSSLRADAAALDQDIIEGLGRRLKREGIRIVDPNKVASWLEDRGGRLGDPAEIAADFKTNYIIHVEIDDFKYREDNSPTLYRGQVSGSVVVYEVKNANGKKVTAEVFRNDVSTTWPDGNPIEGDARRGQVFLQQFIGRICDQLAILFYDHPSSAEVL